jgi:hypothetical protein
MSKAKNISRLRNLGLQGAVGRTDYASNSTNTADTWIQTFEIPLTVVASAAAQTTAIEAGTKWLQVLSAVIVVDVTQKLQAQPKQLALALVRLATTCLLQLLSPLQPLSELLYCLRSPLRHQQTNSLTRLALTTLLSFRGRAIVTAVCANA